MFYAFVEVQEWGEPSREVRIGPFSIEADSLTDAEYELRENLEREGEIVNRVDVA